MKTNSRNSGGNPIWALFLIFIGIVFLLNNFGYLPWDFWATVWRFWPILVVLIGIEIIFGRSKTSWLVTLILGTILMIVIFLLVFSAARDSAALNFQRRFPAISNQFRSWFDRPTLEKKSIVVDASEYENVDLRDLEIVIGASEFMIEDDENNEYFVFDAQFFEGFGEPTVDHKLENGALNIDVNTRFGDGAFFNPSAGESVNYEVVLGRPDLATDLKLFVGAGKTTIDLDQLNLQNVSINIGAGSVDVKLTNDAIPQERFEIDVGAGKATVTIPKSIGLRVNADVGVGRLVINGERYDDDDDFVSDDFDVAEKQLEIDVDIGAGNVEVTRE